jgi:anti-anti-sigma factor
MDLKFTRQGPITIVSPAGQVDGKAAFQFEQDALELLQDGSRYVVVDMAAVTLLASAGIRVLILMLHKLEARDGILVLCGLNHYVRTVLEVSGLSGQFTIVATTAEAAACFPAAAASDDSEPAALARRVLRLLSIGAPKRAAGAQATPLPEAAAQQLAARVLQALTRASAQRH